MNKHVLSAGLAAIIALGAPIAAQAGDYYDRGYSRDPYDQCVTQRRGNGATAGILGAVIGGLAGNGIAAGKNRVEGAALGAVVGAVAGNAIGKSGTQCSNVTSSYSNSNYGYNNDRYVDDRYADSRRNDDDYDRGYRQSSYNDRYADDDYADRRAYNGGNCRVTYSTTRLPDGTRVREPATYCQSRDGVWTRRN